jgi:predicted enzyme related to lactoylglutathione lyase
MAAKKKAKKTAKRSSAKNASSKRAPKKAVAPRKAPAKKKAAPKKPKPRGHEVVHWEIQSQQPERLHAFYAAALGWKIDANNPMSYGMVASGGRDGIDGGIGGSGLGPGSHIVVYAAVPSIPAVLDQIEKHGGVTVMPRTDIGPVVMALYKDPEGNTMGLIEG